MISVSPLQVSVPAQVKARVSTEALAVLCMQQYTYAQGVGRALSFTFQVWCDLVSAFVNPDSVLYSPVSSSIHCVEFAKRCMKETFFLNGVFDESKQEVHQQRERKTKKEKPEEGDRGSCGRLKQLTERV